MVRNIRAMKLCNIELRKVIWNSLPSPEKKIEASIFLTVVNVTANVIEELFYVRELL